VEGRVLGPGGAPQAGVHVRVIAPYIAPLPMPGGGERALYDLTETALGDAVTDRAGRFRVEDRAPAAPLLGVHPAESDLADVAVTAEEAAEGVALAARAHIELEAPGAVQGVYLLLPPANAVLIGTDPAMSMRPLPVAVAPGRRAIFIRLRDGRWAAFEIDLEPGSVQRVSPDYQR
jgi:hypothetical protein